MKRFITAVLLLIFLVAGCSPVHITSEWTAPEVKNRGYKTILVAGILRGTDSALRRQMEKHLGNDLEDLGYDAFSSYELYGTEMSQNLNEKDFIKQLTANGVHAVLTIVLLDKKKEKRYVPRPVDNYPTNAYHSRFMEYFNNRSDRVTAPGYYEETTKYIWESNFYDLADNRLLFSVRTQSFDEYSVRSLAHHYGQCIIQRMIKSKILSNQPYNVVTVF